MRFSLIVAAATLALGAAPAAFADQGAGDPFPFRWKGPLTAYAPKLDTGSMAYQATDGVMGRFGRPFVTMRGGREGSVETPNTLPLARETGGLVMR